MGTRALDEDSWLVADDESSVELAYKRALLGRAHADVVTRIAGAVEAEVEAAGVVAAASGGVPDALRQPLEAAALLVQEDLCLLARDASGWRLVSGVVCFPSMWRVSDKLGLHVAAIHGPVPAYRDELAGRVDRFLDRLRPERPVWRRNWLVHDSPELHLLAPSPSAIPPSVPRDLWLRSERQTLRRLPETDAILFTIRTQQVPLAAVAVRADIAAGLARAVRSWSEELVAYRSAERWRAPGLTWLDTVAADEDEPS